MEEESIDVGDVTRRKRRRKPKNIALESSSRLAKIYLQRLEVPEDKRYRERRLKMRKAEAEADQVIEAEPSFQNLREFINLDF